MRVPAVHAAATSLDPPGRGAGSPRPTPHTHAPAGGMEHVQGLLAVRLQSGLGVLRLVKAIVTWVGRCSFSIRQGRLSQYLPALF